MKGERVPARRRRPRVQPRRGARARARARRQRADRGDRPDRRRRVALRRPARRPGLQLRRLVLGRPAERRCRSTRAVMLGSRSRFQRDPARYAAEPVPARAAARGREGAPEGDRRRGAVRRGDARGVGVGADGGAGAPHQPPVRQLHGRDAAQGPRRRLRQRRHDRGRRGRGAPAGGDVRRAPANRRRLGAEPPEPDHAARRRASCCRACTRARSPTRCGSRWPSPASPGRSRTACAAARPAAAAGRRPAR